MHILLPGGSGQIGNLLTRAFTADGHQVTIISRSGKGNTAANHLKWDGKTLGDWAKAFDGADVIINLAGRSVDCRYNVKNRRQIMDSRIDSTRVIGEAIQAVKNPPKLWLQSSTATIYAHRFDAANDEETGIIGGGKSGVPEWWDFSIDVAKRWEAECMQVETPETRKVLLRSAMVMSPDAGGVFKK